MRQKGFSYIEMLIAMALFSVMLLPILPIIYHARANHADAALRHIAQSEALRMAAYMRLDPVPATVAENARSDFVYRLTLLRVEGEPQVFVYPENSAAELPAPLVKEFAHLAGDVTYITAPEGTIFITAEIFDGYGTRLGRAVSVRE